MNTSKLAVVLLATAIAAVAAEQSTPKTRLASAQPAPKCMAFRAHAATAAEAPCAECPKSCETHVTSCKDGSVKECYLAAACLCQCNLDAGGCGSDKEALRQCVDDNKKNARDLEP
jgi:hypothetical protein